MRAPDYSGDYDPDADFDRWYTALTARLITPKLGPADRILELGSATGALTQRLVGQQRRITCVERSPAYVARARARGLPGVGLCECAIEEFVPPGQFDHILAINVLHEIPGRAALLDRIRAMLAPQGRLHVTLPNPESLHRLSALGAGLIDDLCAPSLRGQRFQTIALQFADDAAAEMARHGLAERSRQGVLVKPLPNAVMERLSDPLIEAWNDLAQHLPGNAAMTYFTFAHA